MVALVATLTLIVCGCHVVFGYNALDGMGHHVLACGSMRPTMLVECERAENYNCVEYLELRIYVHDFGHHPEWPFLHPISILVFVGNCRMRNRVALHLLHIFLHNLGVVAWTLTWN